jgi:hypothetical protein
MGFCPTTALLIANVGLLFAFLPILYFRCTHLKVSNRRRPGNMDQPKDPEIVFTGSFPKGDSINKERVQ